MSNFRYTLDPGSKKFPCPSCEKKTFVRYMDNETGEYLSSQFGRCDREDNCSYHKKPEIKNGSRNPVSFRSYAPPVKEISKPVSYLTLHQIEPTLVNYEINSLLVFLKNRFDISEVKRILDKYLIGTVPADQPSSGATIFYQVDYNLNIRTGKQVSYDVENGKRKRDVMPPVRFVHKSYDPNFNLNQCLFGEHLLRNNTSPIALFEAEKTAIIASIFFPEYLCLATGGKSYLNPQMCEVLKHRKGIIYPDLSPNLANSNSWEQKARKIPYLSGFKVSDLLNSIATDEEKVKGLDLADYLLSVDISHSKEIVNNTLDEDISEPIKEENASFKPIPRPSLIGTDWTNEIESLCRSAHLPQSMTIEGIPGVIWNPGLFFESHLSICRAQNGRTAFIPYFERLMKAKTALMDIKLPSSHSFYYANNDLSLYPECRKAKYLLNDLKSLGMLYAPF